jgi:hypothetical protein
MMMARTSNCDVEPGVTPIWVVVIIRVWCIDGNHPIVAWPHDRNHPICWPHTHIHRSSPDRLLHDNVFDFNLVDGDLCIAVICLPSLSSLYCFPLAWRKLVLRSCAARHRYDKSKKKQKKRCFSHDILPSPFNKAFTVFFILRYFY